MNWTVVSHVGRITPTNSESQIGPLLDEWDQDQEWKWIERSSTSGGFNLRSRKSRNYF
jgi:hypothetical protein